MIPFKRRRKDLQPWLDYFEMLRSYEQKGFLDVLAEKHEAYVTRAALCTLAGGDQEEPADSSPVAALRLARDMASAIRRIRTYAAWQSREGAGYSSRPFALHMVEEEGRHDLICTVVVTSRRRWWRLWTWHDSIEVIGYKHREP